MPIIGLTNRPAQLPRIGTLHKGAPKPERGPGRDLDHFRFDSDEQRAMEMFVAAYGSAPRRINVYLPFPTTDQNFSAWRESWTASRLNHRCDGETCYVYDSGGALVSSGQPCPDLGKPADDRHRCKQVGRLQIIIPELQRFAYVTVLTTSIHDIIAINEQLAAVEALRGSLQGVPMILSRHERGISMPKPDGSRTRATKWMLSIEVLPEWAALQLETMRRQALALPAPTVKALPGGRTLDTASGELMDAPEDGVWSDDEEGPPPADEPLFSDVAPAREAEPTKGEYIARLKTIRTGAESVDVATKRLSSSLVQSMTDKALLAEIAATRDQIVLKIQDLWRELGDQIPAAELAMDLDALPDADLIALAADLKSRWHNSIAVAEA